MEIRRCRETSEVEIIHLDDKALREKFKNHLDFHRENEKTNKSTDNQEKETEGRSTLLLVFFVCL